MDTESMSGMIKAVSKENGKKIRSVDMVSIPGQTADAMKVSG